ncbi:MAG TPA: PHB depolymerase family esterase [Kofleriaceae bacterium]|jgi:poly(hydroxyalkanoate) depolymerase family esterase
MFIAASVLAAVTSFGSNPGALDMYEYAPANLAANRPVVVVLHGCTQTASAMEVAGWDALADEDGFTVVYPQQRSANQSLSCFTWYASSDISRDQGEADSIIQMVDKALSEHGGDRSRVYVTGLSAGGAFTSVMLAAYPDRFAAGSVMAGLPYACATSLTAASTCQQMGASSQKTPQAWGDLVRHADTGFTGPWPRVQIWQGTADYTVAPANATELVKQWTDVWGTDQTADETDMLPTATRTRYHAGSATAVELYMVDGMGHAIATGNDDLGDCPSTTGAYFSDKSICSTRHAAVFFGLEDDGAGTGSGSGPGSGSSGGSGEGGGGQGDDDAAPSGMNGGCSTSAPSGGAIVIALGALAVGRRRRR